MEPFYCKPGLSYEEQLEAADDYLMALIEDLAVSEVPVFLVLLFVSSQTRDVINKVAATCTKSYAEVDKDLANLRERRGVEMTKHFYGMRLRPCGLGCQPKDYEHVVEFAIKGKYYDLIAYTRKLTDEEVSNFELDYLGTVKK